MASVEVWRGDRTAHAVVSVDDVTAWASAACRGCRWVTGPGRADSMEDAIVAASVHVDQDHQ